MMMLRILLLGVALILSACQSFTSPADTAGTGSPALWDLHRQQLAQVMSWEITGKLGIRSPAHNGSAVLSWAQHQDRFDIRLAGPLGQGSVRLQGVPGHVRLTHPKGTYEAGSGADLLGSSLGWRLPVDNLLYWVRGIPAPASEYQLELNADSQARQLVQDGWTVVYHRYQALGDGGWVPARMSVAGPNITLTVVLSEWVQLD